MIMKRTHNDSIIDVVDLLSPRLGDKNVKILQIMTLTTNTTNTAPRVIIEYIDERKR